MQAWHTRTAHCLHEEEQACKTRTPRRLSFGRVLPGVLMYVPYMGELTV